MYSLDGLNFSHTPPARQFVLEIVSKIIDERSPKYPILTQEFIIEEHKISFNIYFIKFNIAYFFTFLQIILGLI